VVERPPLAELLTCRTDADPVTAGGAFVADGPADGESNANRNAQAQAGEAWAVFVSPRCEVPGK